MLFVISLAIASGSYGITGLLFWSSQEEIPSGRVPRTTMLCFGLAMAFGTAVSPLIPVSFAISKIVERINTNQAQYQ